MVMFIPVDGRGVPLTPPCSSRDVAALISAMERGAATVSTMPPSTPPGGALHVPATRGLYQERACVGPVAVLGDIHGRLDLLDALLAQLDAAHPAGRMPVCVVGDLIDRGPESAGVIARLVERGAFGVRGNHEWWFHQWVQGEGFDRAALSTLVGGAATLRSYGVEPGSTREIEEQRFRVPGAHRRFVEGLGIALRLVVDDNVFYVAHAGVSPGDLDGEDGAALERLVARAPDALLWPRRTVDEMARLDGVLITGHVPATGVTRAPHALCIDTGAGVFDGGGLTAVVLPGLETFTARRGAP